ncbi:LysM peptidoglycan-binding domain-containing protein [Trinickia violacea]|uniref:LysM peptidoglycan-binding domain-containing protein n=1 Tax=Trinickia violacea TaxID=2571746 RepID=A0A4P8J3X6_9BURK|nr:LysM peptidoglycan-binding domain-containing protein [Trinickia violacea]
MTRLTFMVFLSVVLMGASGCTSPSWTRPQSDNTSVSRMTVPPGYYRVNPGDSLDGIATAFGRRLQDVVRWNGLAGSEAIVPGQLLRVAPPVIADRQPPAVHDVVLEVPETLKASGFIWPVQGRVIEPFVAGKSHGVLIGGAPGEPVKAAAAGRVVYAGTAIAAYGPLVIIKHRYGLVTAYAQNGRLLVKDNEAVTQGQVIAEVGVKEDGHSVLQFEVRRNGRQVDPLSLLPAQSRREIPKGGAHR